MLRDPVLGTIYYSLDGLDECDEALLEVLLNKFKALLSTKFSESSACHLNFIITSRDFPEFIPEIRSGFPRIRLDPDADTDVNDDIHQLIKFKLDKFSVDKQYPEALREHVRGVSQDRAKGTLIPELYSVRGIERADLCNLGDEPLERSGLVKWLKEEMESPGEK
jgi:hypothetical protein